MIKLTEILNEQTRSKYVSKEKAVEIYNQNCKEHSSVNQQIYRGFDGLFKYGYTDPSRYKRTSAGQKGNHYTLLMDNLKSWKRYPKRSRSLICSMSKNVAKGYGRVYVVIPFDGSKIGIAPENDIWYSFYSGFTEVFDLETQDAALPTLNDSLNTMYHVLKNGKVRGYIKNTDGVNDTNFDKMWSQIKKIEQNIDYIKGVMDEAVRDDDFLTAEITFARSYYFAKKISNGSSLTNMIKESMDSEKNNFELKKYSKGFRTSASDNEVWTESECLLISNRFYDDFIEIVK